MKEYKSPSAALLWSITMTGFGQFYNGQYIFGTLLFLFEVFINGSSSLNMAIWHSFHGDMQSAHDIFDFQWGMFYPSGYIFSIWHAYNKAIVINHQQDGKDSPKETFLTGFFFCYVIGMNLGVYWHPHFLDSHPLLFPLASPILYGLILGLILGFIGHFIERYYKTRKVSSPD